MQWTGLSPGHDPANWSTITYKYDPSGRRIKKKLVVSLSNPVEGLTTTSFKKPDSYTTTYLYDGDNLIAEYACGEPVRLR